MRLFVPTPRDHSSLPSPAKQGRREKNGGSGQDESDREFQPDAGVCSPKKGAGVSFRISTESQRQAQEPQTEQNTADTADYVTQVHGNEIFSRCSLEQHDFSLPGLK